MELRSTPELTDAFTWEQVLYAVNQAINGVNHVACLPDTGAVDAMNLACNALGYYLTAGTDPDHTALMEYTAAEQYELDLCPEYDGPEECDCTPEELRKPLDVIVKWIEGN